MKLKVAPILGLLSVCMIAACEEPSSGQVMCWHDLTLDPPELICVPVRSMHGRPIPAGAYIVQGGAGGGGGLNPVVPEVTPAPPVFEYTNPVTGYQVNANGGIELSTTENGPAAVTAGPSGESEGASLEEHMENLHETLESLF